jgi:RNA polymerase sigma-70 factor (ECF subfamily)
MAAAAAGRPDAIDVLFDRHADRLYGWLSSSVGPDAAEDLVQQTFLHVHRARRDFRPGARFRPWLFAIAANCRRQAARTRARRPEAAFDAADEPGVAPAASRSDERAVRAALATLPEASREVLLLHWWQGLSMAEIAEATGSTAAAVKVRAHRAYDALRAALGGKEA